MKWTDVRQRFPSQWLLVEATRAHSEDDRRIVEDLAVVDCFANGASAMKGYSELHRREPKESCTCSTRTARIWRSRSSTGSACGRRLEDSGAWSFALCSSDARLPRSANRARTRRCRYRGSAGSVFSADEVAELGILPEHSDLLHRVRGVGGFEFVYSKRIESLALGSLRIQDFVIQVGALHYGFPLQGIVGMDFLMATRAVIDLGALEVRESDIST